MHSIADYGLSAQELEDKYMKLDYHFEYRRHDHKKSGSPKPYWEWVKYQLEAEEDKLQRDNPYGGGFDLNRHDR